MASSNYVLAEYNGQTRKIQGEWSKKSYNNLITQLRNKFNIQHEIEIKVYDKKNNKYFSIDKSEMREIPKGGLIRIGKAKKGQNINRNINRNISTPMMPPGVPPISKADDAKRNSWKKGVNVEIYSEGQRKWQRGEIVKIFKDHEGEWLVIKYAGFRTKEIQRFSNYIRPIDKKQHQRHQQHQQQQQQQQPQQQQYQHKTKQQKADKPQPKGGDNKQQKQKEKKPEKITTQSKYRKKAKLPQPSTLKENEIHIKGNSQHIKKYIDRACILLRGYDAGHTAKHLVDAAKTTHQTHAGSDEDDEDDAAGIDDDDAKKENDTNKPLKNYDIIHLFGTGRAMGHVVSTAEIVKRIVGGLYQVTVLQSIMVTDVWEPLEQGLKEVETTRPVAQLTVSLAKNEKDIDKTALGYQIPITSEDFASSIEYHYPDETDEDGTRGRGRGRGRGGRGRGTRGIRGGRGTRGGRGGTRGGGRGRGGGGQGNRGRGRGNKGSKGGGRGGRGGRGKGGGRGY